MALSGAQVTRFGLYGGTRSLYGDFSGKTEQIILPTGKSKRRVRRVTTELLRPWEAPANDEIDEQIIEDIKKPLKLKKRAPQPEFDDLLEPERLQRELVAELQRVEKERKKRYNRKKAIEMLLLS